MRGKAAVVSSLLLVTVLGCGDQDDASSGTTATTTTPASDCGTYEATHRSTSETFRIQQECLIEAFDAGTPATLAYRYPSEEGAPIAVRMEVLGPRWVEVETDTRQDNFAVRRAVTTQRCRDLAVEGALLLATDCQ